MLLPNPSCLERLHTVPSQSILIQTVEPLNTRPSLHILPKTPHTPFSHSCLPKVYRALKRLYEPKNPLQGTLSGDS